MFSTPEHLRKRTGKNKVERYDYLKLLVEEYKSSPFGEAKEQVLANLANFAYDPINYHFIRELLVIDLFLSELECQNDNIVEFAIAGLCNLCLDFQNKDHIIDTPGGIQAIKNCLTSSNEEIVISAITTLIFIINPKSKKAIASPDTIEHMVAFSRNPNIRIKNLAKIFLGDYCSKEEVSEATARLDHHLKENLGTKT